MALLQQRQAVPIFSNHMGLSPRRKPRSNRKWFYILTWLESCKCLTESFTDIIIPYTTKVSFVPIENAFIGAWHENSTIRWQVFGHIIDVLFAHWKYIAIADDQEVSVDLHYCSNLLDEWLKYPWKTVKLKTFQQEHKRDKLWFLKGISDWFCIITLGNIGLCSLWLEAPFLRQPTWSSG